MKQNFSSLFIALCMCMGFSQSGIVVAGFPSSGPGGSSSSSTGQVFQQELSGQGGSASSSNQVVTLSTTTNGMYSGNGQDGFGGPVGGSSLNVSDNGTTLTFNFTKGSGDFNDIMVIYLDTYPSSDYGWPDTSLFNDTSDGGRRAISNAGSGTLTFPSSFEANYAITVETGFVGLWDLQSPDQYGPGGITSYLAPTNLGTTFNNNDASFSFSVDYTALNSSSVGEFNFVITYGNGSSNSNTEMFTSNEAYGENITSGNPGANAFSITNAQRYIGSKARFTTNGGGTLWSDPNSWDRGLVPQPSNPAWIFNDLIMDVDVTLEADGTPGSGYFNLINASKLTVNPGVTLTLNGTLLTDATNFEDGLIFESDNTGSGQLLNNTSAGIVDLSGSGVGKVVVKRFIPSATNNRRAYRFVTSSVNTSTSIYQNWQTGGASVAGVGTQITGSTTGANGFDATVSGNGSMLEYIDDGSGYAWNFVSATNDTNTTDDNLVAGKPYNLFIRGDRNYDLSTGGNPNADTVLPATGVLNLAQSVSSGPLNTAAGGFDFVGNPYQATIDMTAVTKNGINPNFMYTWDPNAATNGAYLTVDISSSSTDPERYLEPGQAFFVVNNPLGGAASIDFLASAKVPSATNGGTFSTPNTRPTMTVELWDNGTAGTRYDTAKFNFDGDNTVDAMDAPEINNWEENLSINKNGTLLSLENRAMPIHNELIQLDFSNVQNTDYQLRLDFANLALNLDVILVDHFLATETALGTSQNLIDFTVDLSDPASFANDRFALKFEDATLSNALVTDLDFAMYPNPATADVLNFNLSNASGASQVVFYTALGQEAKKVEFSSTNTQIKIDDLSSGVYLVKITNQDQTITKKLIIE